jgi:PAS domain S-box-containing protein
MTPHVDFRAFFEQSPAACLVVAPDAAFTILAVTEAYLRATLRRREELVGRRLFEAFPDNPEDPQTTSAHDVRASLERVLATRAPDILPVQKYDIARPDGSFEERYWSTLNSPLLAEDGSVRCIMHQVEDVTHLMSLSQRADADRAELQALRQAEAVGAALRRKDAYLRRVLNANQVGTWELELATQTIEADVRLLDLFFLPEEARHLDAFLARIHPEDLARANAAINGAIGGKDGGRYLVEYRVVDPVTGRVRWLEARGQAYFDDHGQAERFFGTVLDITERKVAELMREGLLEALAAQPLIFVALLRGPQLVFELTNPLYESLFRGQQLVGRPLLEALPELKGQGLDTLMYEAMASGKAFVGREMVVPLVRGEAGLLEQVIFNFVYQPVRGVDGTYDGILIVGVEVTQEVRVRQEAQARLAFEERLTAIVGHDLRSPLAALRLSAAQLVAGGQHAAGLTPGQARAVERVARGAQRIQAVITSLLDLTRARGERGFPIQAVSADLDVTARRVLEELRVSYPQRPVHYEHQGDTQGHFDPERIAQVAVNLLENAFRYGDTDSEVSLRCEGAGSQLRLVVHNAGSPIDPELQARLFQPFVRGPQSMETVKVSMGLGLYIVREIVRAHGGHITLDSSAEGGTTFTVELPREGPPPADVPPAG